MILELTVTARGLQLLALIHPLRYYISTTRNVYDMKKKTLELRKRAEKKVESEVPFSANKL